MNCDPPYKLRQIVALANQEHDFLNLQNMNQFIEVLPVVMDVRANGPRFWSALQFVTW